MLAKFVRVPEQFSTSDINNTFYRNIRKLDEASIRKYKKQNNRLLNSSEKQYQKHLEEIRKEDAMISRLQFSQMSEMLNDIQSRDIHYTDVLDRKSLQEINTVLPFNGEYTDEDALLEDSLKLSANRDSLRNYTKFRGFPKSFPKEKLDEMNTSSV